jgi:hypothetical protein
LVLDEAATQLDALSAVNAELVARVKNLDVECCGLTGRATRAEQERDAAFAMSKCECGADECCANLARLQQERDEAVGAGGQRCAARCDQR